MIDLRNVMSGIFTRGQEWEIIPETFANPIWRVKVGRKWTVHAAKGLFHRMIVQSTISDTALWGQPEADATRWAGLVLARLGLKANQLDQLQNMPAEKL